MIPHQHIQLRPASISTAVGSLCRKLLYDLQAKKKAQQEAAAKRTGGKNGQAKPAASSSALAKAPQSDFTDSESDEEGDMQMLSQQNSRFASLAPNMPTGMAKVLQQGDAGGIAGLSKQTSADAAGAAESSAADSDNEAEEGHEGQCNRLSIH